MSYNVLHDNVGDVTKPPDWKTIKAKRIRVDEIILNGNDLPYTAEQGPNLTAYDDTNVQLITNDPIRTRYQRLGEVITIGIDTFTIEAVNMPVGGTLSIRLDGLDFPPIAAVSGVWACDAVTSLGTIKTYIGSVSIGDSEFLIKPENPVAEFTGKFILYPTILTYFY